MDLVLEFFLGFINKFLGQAPLLLGTVVFLGYLLLGKKWYESLAGFIKTYVGFKILQVGTGGLVATFRPIISALTAKFGITSLVIDPYYGQTSATEMLDSVSSLQYVGYVMIIAFILNILLVAFRKYTKIRTLFITGHIMYQQSAVLLWALYWVLEGVAGVEVSWSIVMVSGLLIGTYWAVASNLIIEATNEVTDGAGFTTGHQQMFGAWFAYKIGGKLGDKNQTLENKQFPGWLSILNDNVVSNVLIMSLFVGTIMFIVGPSNFTYDQNKYFFVTYVFEQTAYFAVYIAVIQLGVRMFVSELTNSFQGISNKLLPGSVPAVDCAVTFGFAPNAVMYGFIFGFIGQMLAIGALILFQSPIVIIAGFIVLFFDNGTLAIFASKAGGIKAAAIIPFFAGMIQVFGSAWVLSFLVDSPFIIGWMGMFDWATLWAGTTVLTSYIGIIIPILLIPALLVIPQLQYRRHKDTYFTTMRDEVKE
jgi:PTS system ascorbate-specific IIC component